MGPRHPGTSAPADPHASVVPSPSWIPEAPPEGVLLTPRPSGLGVFHGLGCDWGAGGVDVCPWAAGVGQYGPRHDEGPEWKSGPECLYQSLCELTEYP